MQIVVPRSPLAMNCSSMIHTESNTQLDDGSGSCYQNFKCEKVVDLRQSDDSIVSTPTTGAKTLQYNQHLATSTDMIYSPNRVRWLDNDSPSCSIDDDKSRNAKSMKGSGSALRTSSYAKSNNTNKFLYSCNTNAEVNKIEIGCNVTPLVHLHTNKKKVTIKALQRQMKRMEEKIHQAAKLELYHMNQSKELREKRSRMMSIYEKMNNKLIQSSNTNNNTNKIQPQQAIQSVQMEMNDDVDHNNKPCLSSSKDDFNSITTYHKFPPLYNPKSPSSL